MTRRDRMLQGLDQEIQDFIDRETQDNIERGMSPEDARYAALRKIRVISAIRGQLLAPAHLDILLEALYPHLECLLKSRKNASSFCKVPWIC